MAALLDVVTDEDVELWRKKGLTAFKYRNACMSLLGLASWDTIT